MTKREKVIEAVSDELVRAEEIHPEWPEDIFEQLSIISEELGEVHKAALQAKHEGKSYARIRKEGVQLAAMAFRFLFNHEE